MPGESEMGSDSASENMQILTRRRRMAREWGDIIGFAEILPLREGEFVY